MIFAFRHYFFEKCLLPRNASSSRSIIGLSSIMSTCNDDCNKPKDNGTKSKSLREMSKVVRFLKLTTALSDKSVNMLPAKFNTWKMHDHKITTKKQVFEFPPLIVLPLRHLTFNSFTSVKAKVVISSNTLNLFPSRFKCFRWGVCSKRFLWRVWSSLYAKFRYSNAMGS